MFRLISLLLVSALVSTPCGTSKSKTILEMIELRNCSEQPEKYKCFVGSATMVRPSKEVSYFISDFVCTATGTNRSKIKAELYRCTDRTALNCEYSMKADFSDGCKIISKKNEFWSPIVESSKPLWTCPLNKGTYKFSKFQPNSEKSLALLPSIPFITQYYWLLSNKYYMRNQPWVCFEVVFKLSSIRA